MFNKDMEYKVRDMFIKAVEVEVNWGEYITQNQILGLSKNVIQEYIRYLADLRLEAVGYKKEYNAKNSLPWVESYSSFNSHRTNFFEGNVTNYSKGSVSFDDI
jgi:ribonucleoside-diphosphate reductase beta chain